MKTFSFISLLAVTAAIILLPVSFELIGSLLIAGGVVTMVCSDYGRKGADASALPLAARRAESLRLAA